MPSALIVFYFIFFIFTLNFFDVFFVVVVGKWYLLDVGLSQVLHQTLLLHSMHLFLLP